MKHSTKLQQMIIAVMLLCVLCLQACSTTGTGTANTISPAVTSAAAASALPTPAATPSMYNEPGTYPIVNEKQDLNIMIPADATIADYNKLYSTDYFENLTNVHINWDVVADITAVKSVILASGAVPDIFASCDINNEEQMIYGEKGLFINLAPYIDSVGHYIKDVFAYDESVRKQITAPDGGIYSLPTYSRTAHMINCNKMWINKAWLDNLKLKAPTTLDEFYNVLVAFKNGDPNRNSKADEIPLSGRNSKWWDSCIPYIMSCFILDDGYARGRFVQPYNGKADVIFNKDEYREGLRFLAKLYSEGLLDAEAFTQDNALRKQKVSSSLVGATPSNAPSNFAEIDTAAFASFEPLAPLKGPNGLQGTARNISEADFLVGHYTITSKCANPELAFRWADTFYDEKQNLMNLYGQEGVNWRYAKPDEIGINGQPAIWALISVDSGGAGNVAFNQKIHSFMRAEWRLGEVAASKEQYYLASGMETRLYDAYALYKPYTTDIKDIFYPSLLFINPASADEYTDIRTDLYKYVDTCAVAFITGSMNLDTDWFTYLTNLDGSLELDRYLELTQAALDKK